jgi:hypothetical protein
LRLLVSHLHAQAAAGRCDRQVPVAQTADQVEGLACRLLERQAPRVLGDALLDRLTHLRRRPEEAVGRHQALDALVRTLEVVRVHEESEASFAVREVGKHRPTQEFLPQCLPESLHLAQRLRMLRPALDVPNALPTKLLLEVRLPTPRRVLAPLVRQDLLRCPVRRDAAGQCLHHQHRPLMVRERPRHDEARVVIHEGCQVQPLVASEQKREDVRLPHLIGRRPLEATRPVLSLRGRLPRLDETRLVQDAAHLRLAHPQRLEARQHVADTARAVLRVLLAQGHHRLLLGLLRRRLLTRRRRRRLRHQSVHAPLLVGAHPLDDRCTAGTEDFRQPAQAHRPRERLLHHPQPQCQRVRPASTCSPMGAAAALLGALPVTLSSLALAHTVSPSLLSLSAGEGGTVLGDFD